MQELQTIKRYILPLIVLSQFACTSMWFAGNAVIADIIRESNFDASSLAHVTSAVQLGFIAGTLVFALFTISDRFSPSSVFFTSAITGALFNITILFASSLPAVIISRLLTGFCLAGIYPVDMKIASDYHNKGLGKALGYLVGALVLGTAFPHLLKSLMDLLPWKNVLIATSVLSVVGGLVIMIFVPDGPYRSKSSRPNFSTFFKVFSDRQFRSAAFGYFGHMWEVYTFWAFVPLMLSTYNRLHASNNINVSITSFIIIAAGAIACVAGGFLSNVLGSAKTAFIALLVSCICCLLYPFIFNLSLVLFLFFLLIWGMAVAADSPQFSTLVAQSASAQTKGTALTIVNCIGFFITIVSIQFLNLLLNILPQQYCYMFLAAGPVAGLFSIRRLMKTTTNN